MSTTPRPRRGEVWTVRFDPSVGAEIRKVRPAVVVSRDSIGRLPLRIVVPITDWKDVYRSFPWFVFVPADLMNGLSKDSGADTFQLRSVSEARFLQQLGHVSEHQLDAIGHAIALCIDAP